MRFELDEIGFKDQIDWMNVQNEMRRSQMLNNQQTLGFNIDTLYNEIEK